MKEFKEMTDVEKLNFVKSIWKNDTEKFYNKMINQHIFLKTKDNLLIMIENEKNFEIHKVLYFDDEQEIPEKTKRLFIDENLKFSKHLRDIEIIENENNFTYFCGGYTSIENSTGIISTSSYTKSIEDEKLSYFKRFLTEEERKEYLKILKMIKLNYIERLSKYFDKYNKNVYCMGYWVNR